MTSRSQSSHYYNRENDALSSNSRKINNTFHRKGINNQYENHNDMQDSYDNKNIYGISNCTITVQKQPFEMVGDVNADASDMSRSYRNMYWGNNDDLILSDITSTKVSSTSLVAGGNENCTFHISNGYNINDNVNYRSQMYKSYTTDSCKTDGDAAGVGVSPYSYNVSLATVGSYGHTMYKRFATSDDTAAGFNDTISERNSKPLYNGGENVSERHSPVVSAKLLPEIPYDNIKMHQPQCFDANIPQTTFSVLQLEAEVKASPPQYRKSTQIQAPTVVGHHITNATDFFGTSYISAVRCTTEEHNELINGDFVYGGPNSGHGGGAAASLRLLPPVQRNQIYDNNIIQTQLLQGENMRPAAQTVSSTTKTTIPTMATATNSDYIISDNPTIRKSYENLSYDDKYNNRTQASTRQRSHTSMGQPALDVLEYGDYRVSHNNTYNNCINSGSLSLCSENSSHMLGAAQKLQLQQQRKYAIMMEMTTASVIASGETRVPMKRISDGKQPHLRNTELSTSGAPHNDEVMSTTTRAKNVDEYGFLGNESVSAVSKLCGRTCTPDKTILTAISNTTSNKVFAHLTPVTISTKKTTNDDIQKNSSADTSMQSQTYPKSVTLVATSRKLPKRLPTPKYDSYSDSNRHNNNNSHNNNYHHYIPSNSNGKVNDISKKLPKLPVEDHKTVASAKTTDTKFISNLAVSSVCVPEAMQPHTLTYAIKAHNVLETSIEASASTTTTSTTLILPSLTMDTFSSVLTSSLTCSTPVSVSEPTASTASTASRLSSAYVATSCSPTYLAYLPGIITSSTTTTTATTTTTTVATTTTTTTPTTNSETTADNYLISLKPSKEDKESKTTKTAISTATTTTKAKSNLYEIPKTKFLSNVPFLTYETDNGTSNLTELPTTVVSNEIVTPTSTKNAYIFGDSHINSHNNNCTAFDENTSINSNANVNNSIICGTPKFAMTIATTQPTPRVIYPKMIPAVSNCVCTDATSSLGVNLYASYLQSISTTSTTTSSFSNPSLASSINTPSYTFNSISYTPAALPVLLKPSAEIKTATTTTPISLPTSKVSTKTNLTSTFSSNDISSFSNNIFKSDKLLDSETNENLKLSECVYYISTKTMDDNSDYNILAEYLNNCGNSSSNNFMLPTSTKITTPTTTTISISSIISSVSLPLSSLITLNASNSMVTTTAITMELPVSKIAATQNTSIESYPDSSIITATLSSKKIEPQLKTTIDSSTDTFANATTPIASTTCTTKYQHQKLKTTDERGDKIDDYNSNSATDIKSELQNYIKNFLNCDMSKPNFSDDNLDPFDLSLETCEYNNYLNISGYTLHSKDTTASTSIPPSTIKSEERIGNVTSMPEFNRRDNATHKGATDVIIPIATPTTAATIVGVGIMEFLSTLTPSTITTSVVSSDGNIVDATKCRDIISTKTTMPVLTTATEQSIARAFDDNFYDSFSVDWSTLTPFTAVEGFDASTESTAVISDSNVNYAAAVSSILTVSGTTPSATAISRVNLAAEGGYYRPMSALKTTTTTETSAAATTIGAPFSVAGKATSVFGGISKGLKGGLDGVLNGVNIAATSETNTKEQQQHSSKKSGFGFGLASKYVPNVGGLLAGAATVAVQQTNNVVKAGKGSSDTATGAKMTDPTATATNAKAIAVPTNAMQYPIASVTCEAAASSNTSNRNYDTNVTIIQHHLDQYGELLYTNSHIDNMKMTSHEISDNAGFDQKMNIRSEDMLLNAIHIMRDNSHDCVSSVNNITYIQQTDVVLTSDNTNTCYNSGGYNSTNVMTDKDILINEYGCTDYNKGYEEDILQAGADKHSVTYAKQRTVDDSMRFVGTDDSMTNNTALINESTVATYYRLRQRFSNEHKSQLQQQQEVERESSFTKEATSSLLPTVTNVTAQTQSQRLTTGDICTSIHMLPLPTATTVETKITTGGGGSGGISGGGMFGSFLGKAAAAVQSATQAVNQATTAVQQKAAPTAVISATTTAATSPTITAAETAALAENNDYNFHHHQQQQPERQQTMLMHQKSVSNQYSATAAISADFVNRNLYNYNNNAGTDATFTCTASPDAATLEYPNYHLNSNPSQLRNQQQTSKLLPTVPTAGSAGKKLPTINTCKPGFLIKQQPTEVYDEDLIIDDVSDTNVHQLSNGDGIEENDGGVDENDGEIIDKKNENDLSDIEVIDYHDDGELNLNIAEGHNGNKLNPKQQCSQQLEPNYEIDSEHANYYIDSQLHALPPDVQQKLTKHDQQSLADNSYYEHMNGGYDYQEDYFNEEDEYKYLEKEEEIFNIQQLQQKHLRQQYKLLQNNQQEQQNHYQYDNGCDIYLEENYQSEDSGNYLDESSSGSVIGAKSSGAKANKQPTVELIESQSNIEDGALNTVRPPTSIAPADNTGSLVKGTSANMASIMVHQYQIKKQDSIILEEDEDDILINDMSVSNVLLGKDEQNHNGRASHESMTENEDIMSKLPSLSIVASKKKMLMRGETEEVVSGHMQIMRKPEVTAKRRWHWAYNKIIMQLN
ncbi:uncharacterized protein LOC105665540 isoform X2 [Ceratitis capitata]|nr:uncharacterized protein LOC105665540 isoform X2 [Ceratitis capitata]